MSDLISLVGPSPFHAGERAVQERLGARDIEPWARRVIRDHLPDQHRAFHTSLPFLVIGARDSRGLPWATVLAGEPGFITSPDPSQLRIDATPAAGDALAGALEAGADIGILGIKLATRRRNRVNGRAAAVDGAGFVFEVDQAFGNCPQYIRERGWRRAPDSVPGTPIRGKALNEAQSDFISEADTFFIASGYRGEGDDPAFGMDASHRGGDRGFVEVLNGRRIRFPDYAGNNHFNTLGNIVNDPRVGVSFVDFATGTLLQLSGRALIDWDSEEVARFEGARRLVTIDIDEVVEVPASIPLRWEAEADSVRSLRLMEKIRESADVTSFVFEARDGGPLPSFAAGQHLPILLSVPGRSEPVARTYSLSGPPAGGRYRISVKREPKGLASRYLHDELQPGAIIDSRIPAGEFVLPVGTAPIALVSAGVGITPMLSMLHDLVAAGDTRPVWFVHGARDGRQQPFRGELAALAGAHPNLRVHVAYSRPRPEDKAGRDYQSDGRVDADLLGDLVQVESARYLLCGPSAFMAGISDALQQNGVPDRAVFTETFGPVG